jgi:hypothetical protein
VIQPPPPDADEPAAPPQRRSVEARFEADDEEDDDIERPQPRAVIAEPMPQEGKAPEREGPPVPMPRQLEARINRERAERGAQVARLEALVRDEVERLKDLIGEAVAARAGMPSGVAPETSPARLDAPEAITARGEALEAVLARLDALEAIPARLAALEGRGRDADAGEPSLRLPQLNNLLSREVMPRIEQMIDRRVAAAVDPVTLRQTLGLDVVRPATEGGEIVPAGALDERVAAAHAAIASASEAARIEREAMRAELDKLQRSAQRALSVAMNARRTIGEIGDADTSIADRLAALQAAVGGGGREGGGEPLADIRRDIDELRGNLDAIAGHVERMGEHYQALLARIERSGTGGDAPPGEEAGAVAAEVGALRDALTSVMAENREIRAQQERLSSRIEDPGRSG